MIINNIHCRDGDVKQARHPTAAHIKQEIVIRLTHEPMMNILPFTCRKSTEHAAHLPAW